MTMNALAILAIIISDIISIRARMDKGRVTHSDLVAQLFFLVPALLWLIFAIFHQILTK